MAFAILQFGLSRQENTVKKCKAVLIASIPFPYRIPLFEKIAEHLSLDLCVYFAAITEKDRKWTEFKKLIDQVDKVYEEIP